MKMGQSNPTMMAVFRYVFMATFVFLKDIDALFVCVA